MSSASTPEPKETKASVEFQRVDLTGSRIRRWTVRAREALAAKLQAIAEALKRTGDAQLPGSNNTLETTIKHAPAKGIKFLESKLEQTTVDNQLKSAQTETEFLKQELLREQAGKARAETRAQQLSNLERELEIRNRIAEITGGRTDIRLVWDNNAPTLVIGNLTVDPDEDRADSERRDSG